MEFSCIELLSSVSIRGHLDRLSGLGERPDRAMAGLVGARAAPVARVGLRPSRRPGPPDLGQGPGDLESNQ